MTRFKAAALCAVLLGALSNGGCAAVGFTLASAAGGVAMGSGVEHTMSGITYKTFTAPLADLRLATLESLQRMDIAVEGDAQTDDGWMISATARDRLIDVELESLTGSTTRMRVVANKGQVFFKDAATATEIILQTVQSLDDQRALAAEAAARAKRTPAGKQATAGKGKRS
jgi:hypothetical protein